MLDGNQDGLGRAIAGCRRNQTIAAAPASSSARADGLLVREAEATLESAVDRQRIEGEAQCGGEAAVGAERGAVCGAVGVHCTQDAVGERCDQQQAGRLVALHGVRRAAGTAAMRVTSCMTDGVAERQRDSEVAGAAPKIQFAPTRERAAREMGPAERDKERLRADDRTTDDQPKRGPEFVFGEPHRAVMAAPPA